MSISLQDMSRHLRMYRRRKSQQEQRKKKLETMSGKTVVMELKTDPSVLAGVRVELDGKLFDGTVKGRLAELSRRISDTVV